MDVASLDALKWQIGQTVTMETSLGPVLANVSGVFKGPLAGLLIMHYEYIEGIVRPESRGYFNNMFIPTQPDRIEPLGRAIDDLLASNGIPTMSRSATSFMRELATVTASINDLISLMTAVIVIVMGMVAATTISMSLRQRKPEMAVLRVLGFTRERVFFLIILESIFICLVGSLIGAGLMFGLFHHEGIDLGTELPLMKNIVITPGIFLMVLAAFFPTGMLIVVGQAVSSARQNLVQALAD